LDIGDFEEMQHIEYIDLIVSPLDKIHFCQGGLIIHKFDMLQKGISILLNLLKKIVSNDKIQIV